MATLWDLMNARKVLIDQSNDWVIYVWIAKYPRPEFWDEDQWYKSSSDTAEEIRQIRKIEESNGITEISYPDGNYYDNYAWDSRASYTYK